MWHSNCFYPLLYLKKNSCLCEKGMFILSELCESCSTLRQKLLKIWCLQPNRCNQQKIKSFYKMVCADILRLWAYWQLVFNVAEHHSIFRLCLRHFSWNCWQNSFFSNKTKRRGDWKTWILGSHKYLGVLLVWPCFFSGFFISKHVIRVCGVRVEPLFSNFLIRVVNLMMHTEREGPLWKRNFLGSSYDSCQLSGIRVNGL